MLYDYDDYTQSTGSRQRQGYGSYTYQDDQVDDISDALNELKNIFGEVSQKAHQKVRNGYDQLREYPMVCEAIYFTAVYTLKLGLYIILIKGAENGYEGSL